VPEEEGCAGFFGERVASVYDDDADIFDPAVVTPVVDVLESLAGPGRALEFGIGTGRIALPLAERGVLVPESTTNLSRSDVSVYEKS
jgi:hypothetical protein